MQTYRPACTRCGGATALARIEPAKELGYDLRTFECVACGAYRHCADEFRLMLAPDSYSFFPRSLTSNALFKCRPAALLRFCKSKPILMQERKLFPLKCTSKNKAEAFKCFGPTLPNIKRAGGELDLGTSAMASELKALIEVADE